MSFWPAISPYLNTVLLAIASGFLVYNNYRANLSSINQSTIADLRSAIESRDIVITDLQAKITTLQAQVLVLQSDNIRLKDLAIGKDILIDIQTTLNGFRYLLGDSGLLATFAQNDQQIMNHIADLKGMISRRVQDKKQK